MDHKHGEYKVPGGKLVIADLQISDGRIHTANLNGDFFLEPDDVLQDLNSALQGLSVECSSKAIVESIDRALKARDDEPVLFGVDPDSIAIAVRRALGKASTWDSHEWEVIPATPLPITTQVALDQVLTERVGAGLRKPAMRLWQWTEPAVVIGSFQSLQNEVDAEQAERHGVKIVRRISGGGAMFMEAENAATYSLYAPQSLVDGLSFTDSYPFLDQWVMEALAGIGVEAFYKPLNDIATPEGKIGGAAQKRLANGGLLHHVTMSYDIDAEKMTQVLRIGREKISDKGIASAKKRVDPLRRQTGLSRAEIYDSLIETFATKYGAQRGEISAEELAAAEKLAAEKFSSHEWTARVP
ncbi:lipoyl protein ligase domain-containing protein [Micrococcoides hystricis]|uniref:Lipoate--protein ligase family protein n=1 Tax=Micrococcoides hystricis TaxID=1572761 RepID=A0ABV6P773_9MICC